MPSYFNHFLDYRVKLFLLGYLLFCLSVKAEENILASPDVDDIAGPVKSVRIEESWYTDKDGERIPDKRRLFSTCEFTPERILKERLFFETDEKPGDRWIREIDDNGRIVLEAKFKGDNRLIAKSEYRYGDDGKCLQTLKYLFNGALGKDLRHRYDENGRLSESQEFQKDVLKRKTVFTYDERGNRTSYSNFTPDEKLEVREEFVYNEKGNLVQSSLFNQDIELMAIMTNLFDEKGRQTETLAHGKEGRVEMRRRYKYDDRGNVVDMTLYGRDDKFMNREVYSYEYDPRGNWIVKYESSARPESNYQQPQRILYRTITYYGDSAQ